MNKIQVVVKEPLKKPEIRMITNTLEEKQKVIGGWLEYVPFGEFDLYLNEEGKLQRLSANLKTDYDVIVGTVYVSKGDDEGEDIGLTDEEAKEVIQMLEPLTINDPKEAEHYNNIIKQRFS